MGQPVKMSDQLVLDARLIAGTTERSIAGQIEFWAALGRAIEPLLRTPELLALRRAGKQKALSDCLKDIDSDAGRRRVDDYLGTRPFPHYEQKNGQLVRIEQDGTRTIGRFVNRQFEPLPRAPKK
jgi:ParD-like antitoxin of type II bacterial toxin-antitoxin system